MSFRTASFLLVPVFVALLVGLFLLPSSVKLNLADCRDKAPSSPRLVPPKPLHLHGRLHDQLSPCLSTEKSGCPASVERGSENGATDFIEHSVISCIEKIMEFF